MSDWLQRFVASTAPVARLFCFPHAGGTAASFRGWRERIPPQIELIGVQLPGRGSRIREPAISSIGELTERLSPELEGLLDLPYAFFGHSMGAVIALELAQSVVGTGRDLPAHLFLSARRPPHLPRTEPDLHRLPDAEFLHQINERFGGVPPEVLRERELLALLLPSLRADITALETFDPPKRAGLSCALTVLGGDEDRLVTLDQLRAWRGYTTGPFRVRQFRGDHFYLNGARPELLAEINHSLSPLLAGDVPGRRAL